MSGINSHRNDVNDTPPNTADDEDEFDTTAWNVHRRSQRKKSSPKHPASVTESSNRRRMSTNVAVPEWMNQFPYRVPPSSSLSEPPSPHQQHILLLVGFPGSGKSVLATTLRRMLPWKYMSVNQDILQSRPACLRETQRILDMGKSPIIDRCNISRKQREFFTQFTTSFSSDSSSSTTDEPHYVPVDCVVLQTVSVQECIQRCQQRTDHPTLPPHQAHRVIGMMQKEWEAPTACTAALKTAKKKMLKSPELLRSVVTIQSDTELQQFITTLVDAATVSITNNEDDVAVVEDAAKVASENEGEDSNASSTQMPPCVAAAQINQDDDTATFEITTAMDALATVNDDDDDDNDDKADRLPVPSSG